MLRRLEQEEEEENEGMGPDEAVLCCTPLISKAPPACLQETKSSPGRGSAVCDWRFATGLRRGKIKFARRLITFIIDYGFDPDLDLGRDTVSVKNLE